MGYGLQEVMHGATRRLTDFYWENHFGVRTETPAPALGPDSRVYVTLPYGAIFKILAHLRIKQNDVLVEIGCGKGRVLLAATRFPFAEIVGVELSTGLAEQARSNLGKLRTSGTRVEVLNIAAQDFDFSRGNIFYMYNPFGPDSFRAVLSRIAHGLRENPRQIRIVYVRPCHEDVFQMCFANSAGWRRQSLSIYPHGLANR